jgi:hypothetical protein
MILNTLLIGEDIEIKESVETPNADKLCCECGDNPKGNCDC